MPQSRIYLLPGVVIPLCLGGSLLYGCRPTPVVGQNSNRQPARASSSALPASAAPRLAASPGLVVCFPLAAEGTAKEQEDFGAGCGFYLELHAASRPEMGQSPLLNNMFRAAGEIKRPTLRIGTAADGTSLAAKLGVTHFALGEITGGVANGTLTYRLYKGGSQGKAATLVGAPITAKGSRDRILAALPKMAAALRTRLVPALKESTVPPTPVASSEEMVNIGRATIGGVFDLTLDQKKTVAALWARVPEAAVLYLGSGVPMAERERVVERVVAAYPDNPQIFALISLVDATKLIPHEASVRQLAKRYPHNYALAHTEVWLSRTLNQPDMEQAAAARGARNAPGNPDAQLTYGWTLSSAAETIRRSKPFNLMSPAEADAVARIYPQWFAAVHRAVEIDPDYGKAWVRVATAGTFAGEYQEARVAYDKARSLLGPDQTLLGWGLQMFHPKWANDPQKLREVAEDVARTDWEDPGIAMYMADAVGTAGFDEIKQKMIERLLRKSEAGLAKDPQDRVAHYGRARAIQAIGDLEVAEKEFEKVVQLFPENVAIQCEVGEFLQKRNRLPEAEAAFQNALRINPQLIDALAGLGGVLKRQNRLAEAEQPLKQAVTIRPDYGLAWATLGTVYVHQNRDDEAITAYRKALQLRMNWYEIYDNLCVIYSRKQDWQAMTDIAKQGVSLFPQNLDLVTRLSTGYLKLKQWDQSIAASRYAIGLKKEFGMAHHLLGMALIGKGEISEGRKELERGLDLGLSPTAIQEAKEALGKLPG